MARITKRMGPVDASESSWSGPQPTRRRRLRRGAGVAAAVVAGAALAVSALTAAPRAEPDRSPVAGAQGAAAGQPDAAPRTAPTCAWVAAPDALVHARNPGVAPSPGSVLVGERCAGGWTGRVAWSTPEP